MKKRVLSLFMTIAMVLTLLPVMSVTAMAELQNAVNLSFEGGETSNMWFSRLRYTSPPELAPNQQFAWALHEPSSGNRVTWSAPHMPENPGTSYTIGSVELSVLNDAVVGRVFDNKEFYSDGIYTAAVYTWATGEFLIPVNAVKSTETLTVALTVAPALSGITAAYAGADASFHTVVLSGTFDPSARYYVMYGPPGGQMGNLKNGLVAVPSTAVSGIELKVYPNVSGPSAPDSVAELMGYEFFVMEVKNQTYTSGNMSMTISSIHDSPVTYGSERVLESFSLGGVALTVNEGAKTVTGTMRESSFNANTKVAAFAISSGASLSQGATALTSGTSAITFSGTGQTRTATLTVTAANGATQNYAVTITLTQKDPLPAPTALTWTGNVASFAASSLEINVDHYEISLYKGTTQVGAAQTIAKTGSLSHDFTTLIEANGTGSYTFRVVAKASPTDSDWTDSEAAASIANNYIAKLAAPGTLTFSGSGLASWGAVTGASGYSVQLLRGGSTEVGNPVSVTTGTSYNFLAAMKVAGAGIYTFRVTALGDDTNWLTSDPATSSADFVMTGLGNAASIADVILKKGDTHTLPATADFGGVSYSVTWNPASVVTSSASKIEYIGSPINLPDNVAPAGKTASLTIFVLDITSSTEKLYLNMTDKTVDTITATLLPISYIIPPTSILWTISGDTSIELTAGMTTYTVTATASDVGNATATITIIAGGKTLTHDVEIVVTAEALTQLDTPSNLAFSTAGVASWGAVTDAEGYHVQLLHDGAPLGTVVETSALSANFLANMKAAGAGRYTFTVKALGDDTITMDSGTAAAGTAFEMFAIGSFVPPSPVTGVTTGTTQANAGLPSTLTVNLTGGGTAHIPVVWSGWDSSTVRTITLTGALGTLPDNVVNSGNIPAPTLSVTFVSGGGNGGGGGGGGGGTPITPTTPTTPTADSPKVEINGGAFNVTQNADGSLSISLSASDVQNNLQSGDTNFAITVSNSENIQLNIPISALGDASLTVITDFGTAHFPNALLQILKARHGETLSLTIRLGSFIVELRAGNRIISHNDPAHPFTVTLPYTLSSGRNSNAVVAVKKDGGDKILPFAVYSNGEATFNVTATGTYDLIYNVKSFNDTSSHWASDNITFVAARELFAGTGNNHFSPNSSMTRAMFATVIARIDGADLSRYTTSRFSDVPAGQWYAAAVEWAADMGIVGGIGGDRFGPNTEITREQMAVMLYNYMKYKGFAVPSSSAAAFADEAEISQWALEAVKVIQRMGVVGGKPGNLYDPSGMATRAEVATIFTRFIEAV